MRKVVLAVTLVAAALTFVLASSAVADHDDRGGSFTAKLNGYNEVLGGPGPDSVGSVSSVGDGRFEARLEDGKILYRLTYSNMEGGTVVQAHIHFAQRHVSGGIIAFLCGGSPPASDKGACPTPGGTVTGEIDPSDIIGPAAQGIEPLSFMEAVRAMRAGATYANVHSAPRFPEGEIRGQIFSRRGEDRDDKDDE